jgi:hypothetical protein
MTGDKRRLRAEGFAAGQRVGSRCPYPPGSKEAGYWQAGWVVGVCERVKAEEHQESQPNKWRRILKILKALAGSVSKSLS